MPENMTSNATICIGIPLPTSFSVYINRKSYHKYANTARQNRGLTWVQKERDNCLLAMKLSL